MTGLEVERILKWGGVLKSQEPLYMNCENKCNGFPDMSLKVPLN